MSDRLSARLVLDASGNVVGRQAHLPFGEDFGESGAQEKHHFTSYERDAESGLDYAINRGYSLVLGRFQSADPYRAKGCKVDPQRWNRYRYVRNDPVNLIDRLGLDEEEPNRLNCSNCEVNINGGGGGGFSDLGGGIMVEQSPGEPGAGDDSGGGEGDPPADPEDRDLNPCERRLLVITGELAKVEIRHARTVAETVDAEIAGDPNGSPDGSYGNAVKHCVWNCVMVRNIDLATARRWAEAHECTPQGEPDQGEFSSSDRKNNALGQRLAAENGDCAQLCKDSRELDMIRPPFGPH